MNKLQMAAFINVPIVIYLFTIELVSNSTLVNEQTTGCELQNLGNRNPDLTKKPWKKRDFNARSVSFSFKLSITISLLAEAFSAVLAVTFKSFNFFL